MIPSEKHEMTIVLTPFERYSGLDKAVDRVFALIERPFRLIVLEAGAPDAVRSALEKRQKKHSQRMKILYSKHALSSGALMNLALPYAHTPLVFFLGSDVFAEPLAFHDFLNFVSQQKADISSVPVRKQADIGPFMRPGFSVLNAEAVVMKTDSLRELGGFSEHLPYFLLGADLAIKAKAKGKTIQTFQHKEFYMPVRHASFCRTDTRLFFRQWNATQLARTVKFLKSPFALPVQPEVLRGLFRQQKAWAREALLGARSSRTDPYYWPIAELRGLVRAFTNS